MAITKEEVKYVANLARLDLNDKEEELFAGQLDSILEYVASLNEVDVEGVEPYISSASEGNIFREDEIKEPLDREKALQNAPEQGEGGFVVPQVVEG
jgi:aspartyl-tRNA(Asn)/glutamyl-tRNA(Gln) amidotransferase subunit C